jgi:thioredoxin 1
MSFEPLVFFLLKTVLSHQTRDLSATLRFGGDIDFEFYLKKEGIWSMENEEQKLPTEGQPSQVQEHMPEGESARPATEKDLPGPGKQKTMIIVGIAIVVLVAAALFYFLYLGSPGRQVLASVNGEKITVEQFNKEVEKVKLPERDMFKEEPQQFIEGMVLRLLLLQEAKKQGTTVPPKTYKDTDKEALSPDEALVTEFMKNKFSTPPAVTREEIQEFYKAFKDRMEGKKLDQVAPMIEKIIQEAKQREAFETFMGDLQKNAKLEINQDRIKKISAKPPESNTDEEFNKALQSGMPTLVDFGANSCQPCRLLRPVLKEIDKDYSTKAQILVLDVYKYQKLASEYKVVFIPTLVFFDAKGKEVFRHVGVLEKDQIISKLKEIGMAS